jgi:hypothetical protein
MVREDQSPDPGDPTGAALALKMRPTTSPSATTSKSSLFHSPEERADAHFGKKHLPRPRRLRCITALGMALRRGPSFACTPRASLAVSARTDPIGPYAGPRSASEPRWELFRKLRFLCLTLSE